MTKTVLLGDVVNICSGKERPKGVGKYPVYGGNGILSHTNRYNISEPAVVVGRVGAYCGSVYLEKNYFWLSDNALGVTSEKGADLVYLYYYLKHLNLNNRAVGGAQPLLTQKILNTISVKLPDVSTQKEIANILSNLDAKIELNRRMNETLEKIGQTLFKYYFITNPARKNWEKLSLDEVAGFLNGLAMQKFPPRPGEKTLPVIKIREMTSGITSNTDIASANIPEKYIVRDGDVLFSWSGTLIVKIWIDGVGSLNQHLFKVTSDNYPKWFYYLWAKHHLTEFIETAAGKATTMGHIQRQHLSNAKVFVPDEKVMQKLNKVFQPILDSQISSALQNKTLTQLRDSLLPRLISGKYRS